MNDDVHRAEIEDQGAPESEFDLENLPDEFTPEMIRGLSISRQKQLQGKELTDKQAASLNSAIKDGLAPAATAKSTVVGKAKFPDIASAYAALLSKTETVRTSALRTEDIVDRVRLKTPMTPVAAFESETASQAIEESNHARWLAEAERIEREQQGLDYSRSIVDMLGALKDVAEKQDEDRKTDRRIQLLVAVLAMFTLVAAVTGLFLR